MKYSSGEGKLEVSVYSFFGPINAFFPQRVRSMRILNTSTGMEEISSI